MLRFLAFAERFVLLAYLFLHIILSVIFIPSLYDVIKFSTRCSSVNGVQHIDEQELKIINPLNQNINTE